MNRMTFSCPQCHRDHVEPQEAAFVLAVVCAECSDADAYALAVSARIATVERHAA